MTTPTEPSGLLPPGSAGESTARRWPADGGMTQDWRAPLSSDPPPPRSMSVEMAKGRDRLLMLSGGVLGALLVLLLVILLSPLHGGLPLLGQSAPTPQPTATPVERTLFQAPLTSTNDRNWPNDDQCSQRADGYHVTANVVCILSRYTPPADVNISVDVKQLSGLPDVSYGLAFRRAGAGNFYTFEINGARRWYFFKAANGQLKAVAGGTISSAIHVGLNVTNTPMVRISGTHYTFYVNGQLVGSADDSAFGSGQVGLEGNDQIEVVYTNFKVTKTVS